MFRDWLFKPAAAQTTKLPMVDRKAVTSSAGMYGTLGVITRSAGGGQRREEEEVEEFWKGCREGEDGWYEFLVWWNV